MTGGICQNSRDILWLKKRMIFKDLLRRSAAPEKIKDIHHADSQPPNGEPPSIFARLCRDTV